LREPGWASQQITITSTNVIPAIGNEPPNLVFTRIVVPIDLPALKDE
jgi:hypothetical protein